MSKGEQTQERIVERAWQLASRDGLGGVTIGGLAAELGLSKSGLFAHFRSKEELQLQVLQAAALRFKESVVHPALTAPLGEPRVRALFERWLAWANDLPGGCIFIAGAVEFDDRPGPQRDFLVAAQESLLATLANAASRASTAGHFRPDLDPEQFAFELHSIILGYHHARRLLCDARATERACAAFDRLIRAARA